MMQDIRGCSLADVFKKLEKGKIGQGDAMRWLNIESINELVEIMHVNGRLMPGHRPMRVPAVLPASLGPRPNLCCQTDMRPNAGSTRARLRY